MSGPVRTAKDASSIITSLHLTRVLTDINSKRVYCYQKKHDLGENWLRTRLIDDSIGSVRRAVIVNKRFSQKQTQRWWHNRARQSPLPRSGPSSHGSTGILQCFPRFEPDAEDMVGEALLVMSGYLVVLRVNSCVWLVVCGLSSVLNRNPVSRMTRRLKCDKLRYMTKRALITGATGQDGSYSDRVPARERLRSPRLDAARKPL